MSKEALDQEAITAEDAVQDVELTQEDLQAALDALNSIPRHVQIFEDDICAETVQGLINELNNYTKIDLFFSTNGGEAASMEALIHYLNGRKEDITIYLTNEICSAGTFLLVYFEGCVLISKNLDFILFHSIDRAMLSRRKSPVSRVELLKQLDELNLETVERFRKLGLTEKEIKRYKAGHDVILYRKDFSRLNIPCANFNV